MEKRAGVELKEFYDSLSVEQLEHVLGLTKVAVEGPKTPEIPDGGPVKCLDVAEKAPAKKTTPPELPTAASPTAKTAGAEGPLENMLRNTIVRDVKAKVYPVLAGAGGLAAGGAGGYALGHHAGKKSKTAEKRAELLITALRAVKDAPEYVKHAAAKYVGERL
jgi:hypothetical protein